MTTNNPVVNGFLSGVILGLLLGNREEIPAAAWVFPLMLSGGFALVAWAQWSRKEPSK